MQAMQCIAAGEPRFIETPKPELKPGHALVKTLLVSLCGSDVHMVYYEPAERYPFPPGTSGHEMIGVVEAVDAPGWNLAAGDVALTLAPYHQAMAEYYLAPAEHVLVLPKGKPLDHMLMAQQLGTVIFASQRLPNIIGKRVAVIGLGSAGLFFCAMCRRLGAERVIAMDIMQHRVAVAPGFGATHAFNNATIDPVKAVAELTDGKLADVVIEAAGEAATINLAPALVKTYGHILFFGIPRAYDFAFDYETFFRKYATTTSIAGAAFEPGEKSSYAALDLVASGAIDVTPLLTHRLPFDRVHRGYELARDRSDGAVKVVVEMPGYATSGVR
jgi:threonine dehydrogenase-like Zn-dependent dehydrogenase